MSESRYVVRPKADQDLADQAYYYATAASSDVGHRFLVAAHDTFALLATQPNTGTLNPPASLTVIATRSGGHRPRSEPRDSGFNRLT